MKPDLLKPIASSIEQFEKEYFQITEERKRILNQIAVFIGQSKKLKGAEAVEFIFICTHNSRRSHIAQIWAQAAAVYYDVKNIRCYSGGTEATTFNTKAVKAMSAVGFKIAKKDNTENPRYKVHISGSQSTLIAFSKKYNDPFNPASGFTAVMVCSQADDNCPLVIGAEKRISLPFKDPKDFDGTPQEEAKYHERVLEIGREICYAFSQVN